MFLLISIRSLTDISLVNSINFYFLLLQFQSCERLFPLQTRYNLMIVLTLNFKQVGMCACVLCMLCLSAEVQSVLTTLMKGFICCLHWVTWIFTQRPSKFVIHFSSGKTDQGWRKKEDRRAQLCNKSVAQIYLWLDELFKEERGTSTQEKQLICKADKWCWKCWARYSTIVFLWMCLLSHSKLLLSIEYILFLFLM